MAMVQLLVPVAQPAAAARLDYSPAEGIAVAVTIVPQVLVVVVGSVSLADSHS